MLRRARSCTRSGSEPPDARAAGVVAQLIQPAQFDAALEVSRAAGLRRGRAGHGPRLALAWARLTRRDRPVYVTLSRRVTGFIAIEPAAADRHPAHDRAEAMEISMPFVHASTQREGIGTTLLRRVFAAALAQEFGEFECGRNR
jgi:GNAT superfamily N-acetyltransferase